jgi:hypothetical protein
LALFRYVENRLPTEFYAYHVLRFERSKAMEAEEVRRMINDYGFSVANFSSWLSEGGKLFEYRMTIKSINRKNADALAAHLRNRSEVIESGSHQPERFQPGKRKAPATGLLLSRRVLATKQPRHCDGGIIKPNGIKVQSLVQPLSASGQEESPDLPRSRSALAPKRSAYSCYVG